MTSFKTTKEEDKLIAQGWKLELIPVQHDFPNCQVKYKTKCEDMKSCNKDKDFWDSIERKLKQLKEAGMTPKDQPLRREIVKLELKKPPKEFEDDIERAKKVKFE